MNRRAFVSGLGAVLAAPLGAGAQQAATSPRIGVLTLSFSSQVSGVITPIGPGGPRDSSLREGVKDSGYVQNVAVEYRYAENDVNRLPQLARQLLEEQVSVMVAVGPAALKATHAVSTTIPVVAIDFESDPVASGYVASLGRPRGNVTGTFLDHADIAGKWLQFLREAVPTLTRIAAVWDATTPADQLHALTKAAKALDMQLSPLEVRTLQDFDTAFAAATKSRAQAVVILSSPLVSWSGPRLAQLSNTARLPAISMFRETTTAGCLMSYGPNLADGWHRLGLFVGRILQGAKVADLPIERPSRFELVINLKTAKALGLTVPPSLLLRADQVIE
jgi:putative ABC transport system substrate-binding protein